MDEKTELASLRFTIDRLVGHLDSLSRGGATHIDIHSVLLLLHVDTDSKKRAQ